MIKLNVEDLSAEFIDNLKKLFPGKNVEIKVEEEMDATLKKVITVNPEDLP